MGFGLLGTGPWATDVHAAALAAHPEAELIGVWGRDPAKAASVGRPYGAKPYGDVDALLADVDAVAVALPPDIQAELAIRAAVAGRHLLLDKPLALTVEAADRVVAAADQARIASVIFFTNRFYASVKGFLAEAATREWDGARVTLLASIFQPGNPFGASLWRREMGGLWDIGPHALSVILPVLGSVAAVTAMSGPHDTTHALLRHHSGAVSTLALSLDAPPDATAHEMIFLSPSGPVAVPPGDASPVVAFGAAIDALVSTVGRGETTHPCDVRFGREVVSVLARAAAARL